MTIYMSDVVVYGGYGAVPDNYKVYYIKRADEDIATELFQTNDLFVKKTFKRRAKQFFGDNPDIVEKIENEYYNHKNYLKLVNDYNLWYSSL